MPARRLLRTRSPQGVAECSRELATRDTRKAPVGGRRLRAGLVLIASGLWLMPTMLPPAERADQPSIPIDAWVQRANDVCRPRTSSSENITVPGPVASGRFLSVDDARQAGDYYEQLARLYNVAASGLRRLPLPTDGVASVAAMIRAMKAAAASGHQVFVASRSPQVRLPTGGALMSTRVASADRSAATAGQSTQDLTVVECLLLFGGDYADHTNVPKALASEPPCWDDPNYANETALNETEVPCNGPHGFETYGIASFPTGANASYPGDADLTRAADILCAVRFKVFVGIGPSVSTLSPYSLTSDADQWNAGDHTISCTLHDSHDQPLVGSMQHAAR